MKGVIMRRVKRGRMLMRKMSIFLVIALLVSLLSGCGSGGVQQPTAAPKDPVSTDTPPAPKREDLNLSVTTVLTSIDPHFSEKIADMYAFRQTYEGLYYQNELTGEFEPRIASSYEVSEDGKTYLFKLNENAKFHNGEPVKPSDIIYSFKRAGQHPSVASRVANVESVTEIDGGTIEIKLKSPMAAFMTDMCGVYILNEKIVEEQGAEFGTKVALAGTGPYYWSHVDHANGWTLEAFEDYYRGIADIKTIRFKPISDASAGLVAFEAGELDWYIAPVANWDDLVANTEKYKTEIVPANHISVFVINPDANPALNNPLVRKAIGHAIDKEAMNIVGFNGLAVTTDYMVPVQNTSSDFDLGIIYDYNPEKAKELLAEAGYPDGVDVGAIMSWTGGYYEKMAQVLHTSLNEIGIKCDLQMIEQASVSPNLRSQNYDIATYGWSYYGDYSYMYTRWHSSQKGAAYVVYNDKQFDGAKLDALLEAGAVEMDTAKRTEIYKEYNDMFMDTATCFPCINKVQTYVWNKDLKVVNYPNFPEIYNWSW